MNRDRTGGEPLPWLLRRAVRRYLSLVRGALDGAGFADLPQQGFWVVNALEGGRLTGAHLAARMQISKQAVSQLVESLVALGYVERGHDRTDRRRILLGLTPRGADAATVISAALAEVDATIDPHRGVDRTAQLRSLLEQITGSPDG